jgi:flagellar motor protein MotB
MRDSSGEMELLTLVNRPAVEEVVEKVTEFGEHRFEDRLDPRSIEYPIPRLVEGVKQLAEDALGGWELAVTDVTVQNAAGSWSDEAAREPVDVGFSELDLQAGPIRSTEGFNVPFEVTGALAEQGRLTARGRAGLLNQQYSVEVDLQSLPLAPVAGYLPRQSIADLPPAQLEQATLRIVGTANASMDEAGDAAGDWEGEIALEGIEVADADSRERLLGLGTLQLQGKASAQRVADGALSLDWDGSTRLRELSGIAPLAGPIDLSLGDLSTTGILSLGMGTEGEPRLRYAGDLRTHDADVSMPQIASARVAYAGVTLTGIEFDNEAGAVRIAQAQIDRPTFAGRASLMPQRPIEVGEEAGGAAAAEASQPTGDGETQRPAATADASAADSPAGERRPLVSLPLPLTVAIEKTSITGGSLELRDGEAERPLIVRAEDLNVDVESLTTDGSSALQLTLNTKLQNSGQLNLTGEVNPFQPDLYADVELDVSTLPLKPYEPIAAYYVGYLIDRGRLTMSLPMKVTGGDLDGTLNASLDTFYLGEEVESPTAPDLPIKLGLDLLRDRQEQIDVSVGIKGNINEPGFSIASVVMRAIFNTLGKAALAPFDLLASAFADEGDAIDDLSMVAFDGGSARVAGEAVRKIDVLARALTDRPGLTLTIAGRVNVETDGMALRREQLEQILLERARRDDPDVRTLPDAQREAVLTALFEERFPERIVEPVPIPPGKLEQKTLTIADMEAALVETVEVPDERYLELARARAQAVFDLLVAEHGLGEGRLAIAEAATLEEVQAEEPMAQFELE